MRLEKQDKDGSMRLLGVLSFRDRGRYPGRAGCSSAGRRKTTALPLMRSRAKSLLDFSPTVGEHRQMGQCEGVVVIHHYNSIDILRYPLSVFAFRH